jgi:hypothetical protein
MRARPPKPEATVERQKCQPVVRSPPGGSIKLETIGKSVEGNSEAHLAVL